MGLNSTETATIVDSHYGLHLEMDANVQVGVERGAIYYLAN